MNFAAVINYHWWVISNDLFHQYIYYIGVIIFCHQYLSSLHFSTKLCYVSGPKQIFLRTSSESTRVWMIFGSENSFSFDFSRVSEHFSKFYFTDWVKIENKLNFITVRVQFDENITIEHIYRTSALEFGWVMWRNWLECLIWIKLDLIQLCHTKWHRNDIELKSEYDKI